MLLTAQIILVCTRAKWVVRGCQLGKVRGRPKHGSVLVSKPVMAQTPVSRRESDPDRVGLGAEGGMAAAADAAVAIQVAARCGAAMGWRVVEVRLPGSPQSGRRA